MRLFCFLALAAIASPSVLAFSQFELHHGGPSVGGFQDFWELREPLGSDFYDREEYASIGVGFTVRQTSSNMLMAGEYWTISLVESITGQPVMQPLHYRAQVSTREVDDGAVCIFPVYGGPDGWVQLDDPYRTCFLKSMLYGMSQWAMYGQNWSIPCVNPGQYEVRVEHFLDTWNAHITVNNFRPGEPVISGVEDITPYVPASPLLEGVKPATPAGVMSIEVTVKDSQNCGRPVSDVPVKMRTTIEPRSGSHMHFTDPEQPGTGQYIGSDNLDAQQPQQVTVYTGLDGKARASYQAGEYGVGERLRASVEVPDTGEIKTSEETYAIRVPDLVPLSTDGSIYTLQGSFTGSCDTTHNASATDRYSHYVTPNTGIMIAFLSATYHRYTGNYLCLNDASLKYGGFFDDGEGGRCHASHRQGIDIDVNTIRRGVCPEDLNNETVEYEGEIVTKLQALDRIADRMGALRMRNSVHYRFEE